MEDTNSKQPSEEPGSTRKRKRKTYSCLDCRRRKLKCDREHPCGRCIKEGHEQSCSFREDGQTSGPEEYDGTYRAYPSPVIEKYGKQAFGNGTANASTTLGNGSYSIDESANLQRKVASLEAKIARMESAARSKDTQVLLPSAPREKETRFFKGTAFETHFYGPTNPMSLFTHFPEVVTVKHDKTKSQRIPQVQHDLLLLRSRRKSRKSKNSDQVVTDLVSLLPPREIMEYMIQLYFDTYETTFRVIHKPTFWREYRASPVVQWREPFIATVLAILASVSCVAVSELSFKYDFSSARVTASKYVAALDNWWTQQSAKHLKIETFQVGLLLLLAKATNALKRKRAWASSGFLLGIAVSAGFQREPSGLSGKISAFEEEMRRRLWASIVEWDLSVSIARGVPSMAASIPSNCRSPLNINDDEFDQDSKTLPDARSRSEQTDASFLLVSLASLPFRTSLATLLNDPNADMSWSEVLDYEERIQQELNSLPAWTRERKTFCTAMLDLQLRQFLLCIHAKQARRPSGPRTAYARMACVNAAAEMVQIYPQLDDADVNALNMLRYDMYQSIVTISLNLLAEAKNASMAWSLVNSLQPVCEKAFLLLEDKVLKVGEGYNHMWFASTSFASAQVALDPKLGDSRTIAIERTARIYYKILAYQEPDSSGLRVPPIPTTNGNGSTNSNGNGDVNGNGNGNSNSLTSTPWQSTPSTSADIIAPPAGYAALLKNSSGEVLDFGNFPDWMDDNFFNFDTSIL